MFNLKNYKKISIFNEEFTNTSNLNHGLHSYPAKFPPQIPAKILDEYAKENFLIFDPFCGSGTTLVEASIRNLSSIGNDINPIALLISSVKTTRYREEDLQKSDLIVENIVNDFNVNQKNLETSIKFDNKDHWFQKNVQKEIEFIINNINKLKDKKIKLLLELVLSEIIVSVSNQESDTRYAAIEKNIPDGKTIKTFYNKYMFVREKVLKFSEVVKDYNYSSKLIKNDARNLIDVSDDTVDMIITSPPYANTYDYYLYHKHRMNWLGYNFIESREIEIGSRNEYSSKKQKPDKWKQDLESVIKEMYRVLKTDRFCFIIIGDSVINKEFIKINELIREISTNVGFEYLYDESTLLSHNSRKFNKKFGTKQEKYEHFICLYKK